jgi:hypothetical protein
MLTATLVQDLPVIFGQALNISVDDVMIMSITSSSNADTSDATDNSSLSKRTSASSSDTGVIVSMAVPQTYVSKLQTLIDTPNSPLYTSSDSQLPDMIDQSYPITSKAGKTFTLHFCFKV